MRRPVLTLLALAALVPSAAWSAPKPTQRWALPAIKVVVAHGLMGATDPAAFRPADALTRGALESLVAGLAAPPPEPAVPLDPSSQLASVTTNAPAPAPAPAPATVANAEAPVTVAQLDARLVQSLGLADAATQFARGARAAGLHVPSRFGTEVTARLLGLRTNHPANLDSLELLPNDPATRAEAAFSAAQILTFRGWEADAVRGGAAEFVLPTLTPWQQQVLDTAVRFVGYPYIWGGESETTQSPFGAQAQGGFDCSGFVWRVYKLQAYPGAADLPATLKGRTTYQMSAEVPKPQRIPLEQIQPADVLFWGAHGPKSKPAEVDHMGIYLGNGWFIHSSEYGVAVARLDGWYANRFAWARRPLAEAKLG
jgi:cell wall-associated NlpC family hydrolase